MPVRKIILVPHPILRQKCAPVREFPLPAELAADLRDTLYSHPGCVGIAAPQIGYSRRVIAVDATRSKKGAGARGFIMLCNPRIVFHDGLEVGREGCLSLPDYTANVARATAVTVQGMDTEGRALELSAGGFEAIVLQHEIDHLDGVIFIDRVANLKTDLFRRKRYL